MVIFNSLTNRPHGIPELNDGPVLVEIAGYVPAKKQIDALLNAGERLLQARRDQFEFENAKDVPDDYYDLTTDRGVDVVDVTRASLKHRDKLLAIQKAKAAESAKSSESPVQKEVSKQVEGPKDSNLGPS